MTDRRAHLRRVVTRAGGTCGCAPRRGGGHLRHGEVVGDVGAQRWWEAARDATRDGVCGRIGGAAVSTAVVVVEPNPGGHRLFYVRVLAEQAARRGFGVVLLTAAGAVEGPEFAVHLRGLVASGVLEVRVAPALSSRTWGWKRLLAARRALRLLPRETGKSVQAVLIPDGDRQLLPAAVLLRPWLHTSTVSALVMRPQFSDRSGLGPAVRGAAKFAVVNAVTLLGVRVFFLRPAGTSHDQMGSMDVTDPVQVVRPVKTRAVVRRELGVGPRELVLTVAGGIDARKNPGMIVAAVAMLDPRLQPTVAMVGSLSAAARAEIAASGCPAAGLRIIDGYLSDEDLDRWLYATDIVIVAHSNDGASGILARAVALGTRAVVAGSPTLTRLAEGVEGLEVAELDPGSIAASITRLAGRSPSVPTGSAIHDGGHSFARMLSDGPGLAGRLAAAFSHSHGPRATARGHRTAKGSPSTR